MEKNEQQIFISAVREIAEQIYERVTYTDNLQALFFNGKQFKLAPADGRREKGYLKNKKVRLVAYYRDPDYSMVLEDVRIELEQANLPVKMYKKNRNWLGF